MGSTLRLLLCLLALAALPSRAAFHLWIVSEFYSNADGTVQYVELQALSGGQQFLNNAVRLTSTNVGATQTNTFTFNRDLSGDTAGKRMLVATAGFDSLGIATADFIVPNGFLFPAGGTIAFAPNPVGAPYDTVTHGALPTGSQSMNRDGSTGAASPTNFAGTTSVISGLLAIGANPISFNPTSMNTTSPPNLVKITNIHSAPVTITNVAATGDFTVLPSCGTLNPGAQCQAGMYFTPTGEGVRAGTLTVTSDAPASPHTAAVSGTGEKSLVTHYYRSILRREPDAGGKSFWQGEAARMQSIGANVNEAWFAMAQQFYFSPEYLGFNRTDNAFVTDLYVTFFNRAPDAGGLDFWTSQLSQGMPREVVLAAFMFSQEFANFTQAIFGNTAARAEVDAVMDFYRGLLSRLPDPGGFDFWIQRFRAAQCQGAGAVNAAVESISSDFMNGAEYFNKGRTNAQFVGDLYNSFLRRGGDLGGVQFWINDLDSTARTRENVRQNFVGSPEFQGRVTAIVNQGCMT